MRASVGGVHPEGVKGSKQQEARAHRREMQWPVGEVMVGCRQAAAPSIPATPTPDMDVYIPALRCPHDEITTGDEEEEEGPGVLGLAWENGPTWESTASDAASDAPLPRNILILEVLYP